MAAPTHSRSPDSARSCLVGAGAISEHHQAWFEATELARLDSIVDSSLALASYAAERAGGAFATVDLDEALDRAPDVVHVLTPPASHVAVVAKALAAGAHVVCEKPLAPTATAAGALLRQAAGAGRMLVENHNYRFNQEARDFVACVQSGALGTVHEVEVRVALDVTNPQGRFGDPNLRSSVHDLPAGVVHDFLPHLVYLTLLALPELRVDDVWARLSKHRGGDNFRFDDLDAVLLGSSGRDPAHVRLRFDPLNAPECLLLRARGTKGTMEIELFQRRVDSRLPHPWAGKLAPIVDQLTGSGALAVGAMHSLVAKLRGRTPYEGIHELLDRFYHAVLHGGAPPVTPEDILATSRLTDRIVAAGLRS